jgi:hypothetical protein
MVTYVGPQMTNRSLANYLCNKTSLCFPLFMDYNITISSGKTLLSCTLFINGIISATFIAGSAQNLHPSCTRVRSMNGLDLVHFLQYAENVVLFTMIYKSKFT